MDRWAEGDFNGRWRVHTNEAKAYEVHDEPGIWVIDFKAVITLWFYKPVVGGELQELLIRASGSFRHNLNMGTIRLEHVHTKPKEYEKIVKQILMWAVYSGEKNRPFQLPLKVYKHNPKRRSTKKSKKRNPVSVRSLVSKALK